MRFLEIGNTVDKNNTRLYNTDMTKINPRTEIYVDMDGVIADFFKALEIKYGVQHWKDINIAQSISELNAPSLIKCTPAAYRNRPS